MEVSQSRNAKDAENEVPAVPVDPDAEALQDASVGVGVDSNLAGNELFFFNFNSTFDNRHRPRRKRRKMKKIEKKLT
tara:strand:+ start:30 stop:260 length:231 start_codon:yes stop_codon:yes gene_type:complete